MQPQKLTLQERLAALGLQPVIWLETHVELNTRTKMFCACPNEDARQANAFICPVCTGHVGTLPAPNKEAIRKTVLLGQALDGKINEIIARDRKHYEYPDLPKWFQLTQVEKPIVIGWKVNCLRDDWSWVSVDIDHIHLEEDAGKLIHDEDATLVDFTRAGRALVEIVTTPCLHGIEDTILYFSYIQKIVQTIGVAEASMEKGHIRSDISVSLQKKGTSALNPRTEIKNINSFKFAKDALTYEIEQQLAYWEQHNNAKSDQVTVLRDIETKQTRVMRTKENAEDYRYIQEPDIPHISLHSLIKTLPAHTAMGGIFATEQWLQCEGIDPKDIRLFSADAQKTAFLKTITKTVNDISLVVKTLVNTCKDKDYTEQNAHLLSALFAFYTEKKFAPALLKTIVGKVLSDPSFDYLSFVAEKSAGNEDIAAIIAAICTERADIVAKIRAGDTKKIFFLVGECLKKCGGTSDGKIVKDMIEAKISTKKDPSSCGFIPPWTNVMGFIPPWDKENRFTQPWMPITYRTHQITDITDDFIGTEVTVSGRVRTIRDHGDLVFIDLWQSGEILQIQFAKETFPDLSFVTNCKKESVICVSWSIVKRSTDDINPKLRTGSIEVQAKILTVLSPAIQSLPFDIPLASKVKESKRLRYRYLDLRNERMRANMLQRSTVTQTVRQFLWGKWFTEIETPLLTKGSDEWSKEFSVPCRLHPGKKYTLPQAPQQFKQLIMVAGLDRYFQIAKCFRDEDERGDRQPEFTQIDMEMAFVEEKDVMQVVEDLVLTTIKTHYPEKKLLFSSLPHLPYAEAMEKYGCDKPDLRFWLAMQDITDLVRETDFKVFRKPIEEGGIVKCLKIDTRLTNKQIEELTTLAVTNGLGGLAYIIVHEDELQSPIVKFLGETIARNIVRRMDAHPGQTVFFAAHTEDVTNKALCAVRNKLGDILGLKDDDTLALTRIVDFPMFEKTDEGKRTFTHNPFSMPKPEHIDLLLHGKDIEKIHAQQYDIVCNGNEIGGGSIRAHRPEILAATYKTMGYTPAETHKRVGHMLEAFGYGAPPHGGLAIGLDRLLMLLQKEKTIRDVMIFPKTGSGEDLLFGAPN